MAANEKLVRLEIPVEAARVMEGRVRPLLRRWGMQAVFDVRSLARDCYHQGLVDGATVAQRANLEEK